MNVLLINLPTSVDRLNFQKRQFRKLKMSFEILKAVAKEDLSERGIEELYLGWERPLRRTELACFLSHKKAWQYVYDNNLPTLILEDDALLSVHTKRLLKSLSKQESCDLVTLEVRGRAKIVAKKETQIRLTKHKLFQLFQDRTGAAAYILWPSGAEKLLNKVNRSAPALADAFISSCYSLASFQIEPAAAIQLDQCHEYNIKSDIITYSTVSSKNRPKIKKHHFKTYLKFRCRRAFSQVKMGVRHLSVIVKCKKRTINLEASQF